MTTDRADASRADTRSALRLLLTPRWLLALLVVMLLAVAAVLLGRWQWDRTQTILAAERVAAAEPIDVRTVLTDATEEVPPESIGRPVTASGSYGPDLQAIVANRSLDGAPGVWVVTGLVQDDGSVIAVLRGWVPDASEAAAAVPTMPVTVSGVLQPDERFYAGAPSGDGTVAAISSSTLADLWSVDVRPGFIVLASSDPSLSAAPAPVPPTVQTADVPFPLQNFFYAFQWWIFAVFGVVVFLRYVWIEAARRPEDA